MIHEQKLSSVIRWIIGEYGQPYEYSAMLLWHSTTEVEMVGVMIPPSLSQTREMIEWLRGQGVETLIRNKSGRRISHKLNKNK